MNQTEKIKTPAKRRPFSSGLASLVNFGLKFSKPVKGARILCYHRVNDDVRGYLSVPVETFRSHMRWLADHGYRTVGLGEVLAGRGDEKSVVITFDDGYLDNFENAYPAMKAYGFTGTIFLVADRIGTPEYLGDAEIRTLRQAGFEFGSHTVSHANLKSLDAAAQQREIADSKKLLEERLGAPCEFFCYPFGCFNDDSLRLVRLAGYRAACSNTPGVSLPGENAYCLKRTEIASYDSQGDFAKKMNGAYDVLHRVLHALRGRP